MAPHIAQKVIGIRPGEKLHEVMCPGDDSRLTLEFKDYYLIQPSIKFNDSDIDYSLNGLGERAHPVPLGFEYSSGSNPHFLSVDETRTLIEPYIQTTHRVTELKPHKQKERELA
jgi:UDP-N-acetylglucosamine 4,6-dehydratase